MIGLSALLAATTLFPLSDVVIKDAPDFNIRVESDLIYLKDLDCDRLLAPFLREAGLPKKAESYGNWECCGLDGHTLGHYLTAISQMIAIGKDKDGTFKRRVDYIVSELARCQKARGDGSCDGFPDAQETWRKIREDHNWRIIYSKWVPWYNLHKTVQGLLDAYEMTGNKQAKEIYDGIVKWADWETKNLTHDEMQGMLGQEHGGINEVLPVELGKRFDHEDILNPLKEGRDNLTGKHANTQIPKIIGFAAHGEFEAAENFWNNVVFARSVAFGGNSVGEHFHPTNDFSKILTDRQGPESCNTYNMLKLTERLFCHDPQAKYGEFYERALFNHILSTVNPSLEHPGFVYFTPLRPEHYRVYSVSTNCFWCCSGTGMENPGKFGKFIYAQDGDKLYVNLWIDSELKGKIRQTTKYPYENKTTLTFLKPFKGTLLVRKGGTYETFTKSFKKGDAVTVENETPVAAKMLPDDSGWGAIMAGNIMLGAACDKKDLSGLYADQGRMSHVAWGPMRPLNETTVITVKPEELPKYIRKVGPMAYRLSHQAVYPVREKDIILKPFANIHECRYQSYWEFVTKEKIEARKTELARIEADKAKRDRMTLDVIGCGEQQPEVEHDMKTSPFTGKGLHNGRHWRHGEWIEYTVDPRGRKSAAIAILCNGGDNGREFTVSANGVKVGTVELKGGKDGFVEYRFAIPAAAFAAATDGKLRLRFEKVKWLAGGLYEVRLLEPGAPAYHE